jgi:hypothetical protein
MKRESDAPAELYSAAIGRPQACEAWAAAQKTLGTSLVRLVLPTFVLLVKVESKMFTAVAALSRY